MPFIHYNNVHFYQSKLMIYSNKIDPILCVDVISMNLIITPDTVIIFTKSDNMHCSSFTFCKS